MKWIFIVLCGAVFVHGSADTKLITILADGFRWDYYDRFQPGELKGLERMIAEGVKASHLMSQFPSSSYCNFYSLMTGLYPESHGMVDNFMYDPDHDSYFFMAWNTNDSFWWDGGDPLWVTATRQGKRSSMWYWPGCDVEIRSVRPASCVNNADNWPADLKKFKAAVNDGVTGLAEDSIDHLGIYYVSTDFNGHVYGPSSNGIDEAITDFDTGLLHLFEKLDNASLTNKVNIMIFSDHGMHGVRCEDADQCQISIEDHIDQEHLERIVGFNSFYPKPEFEDKVYTGLKSHPGLHVWKKEEIPDGFHWKNNPRVPPIRIMARSGWAIRWNVSSILSKGYHDNIPSDMDMWGILLVRGPDFKVGFSKSGLSNIELYQVMCQVMGINPSPHNGTWDHVADMFREEEEPNPTCDSSHITASLLLVRSLLLCQIASLT